MTKRSAIALRLLVKILLNFVIDIPSYMGHILLIMSEYHVKMQDGIFFVICLFLTWQDQLLILLKPTLYLALENNSFIHFFVPYLKENLRSVQSTGKGKR